MTTNVLHKGMMAILLAVACLLPGQLKAMQFQEFTSTEHPSAMSTALHDMFYKTEIHQKIIVEFNNEPVQSALDKVARTTGMRLTYRGDIMSDKKVTMPRESLSVSNALASILEDTGLDYKFSRNGYLLITKAAEEVEAAPVMDAVNQTIRGTVTDAETGETLPGVNVTVEGATTGTTTNLDGEYEIRVPEESVLVFSYVGYQQVLIPIDGHTIIDVEMEPSHADLGEMVVIGYGEERRSRLTGSVGSVSRQNIEAATGIVSPEQVLQGRVSGVNVSSTSGIPGQGFRVDIRGSASLTGGNEPLYVVDGVPISGGGSGRFDVGITRESPISHLSAEDIESIEILKDAAATAIYGSRATNGVVLITTRRGADAPTQINFSTKAGFEHVPNQVQMANSDQWFEVMNEARSNFNQDNGYTQNDLRYLGPMNDPRGEDHVDTDWFDLVTRSHAQVQNYNLSISGGDERTQFYTSGSHMRHEGIILTNQFSRTSGRLNLDHKATDRLDLRVNVGLNQSVNNRIQNEGSGRGILVRSLEQPPHDKPFFEDGSYQIGGVDIPRHNGVQVINEQDMEINRTLALFDASGRFEILPGLRFQSKIGADYGLTHEYVYLNENHPRGGAGGVVFDWRTITRNLLLENTFTFDHMINRNLHFTGLIGHTVQQYEMELNYVQGQDFPSPSYGYITSAGVISAGHSGWTGYTLDSYLSRLNLNYNERYTVSATIRRDGSSKFVGDNRYGIFPSASFGWRISQEEFFQDINAISNLRMRLSYGQTGNQEGIGNFIAIPSATGGHNYRENTGIAITNTGNPDLTWETADQFNVALDMGLFNDRINITTEYFVQKTSDLLYNRPLHGTAGFTSTIANIGDMSNRGFEFEVSTVNLATGPVRWHTDFNISFIRNELTSLVGDEPIPTGQHVIMEGQPLGTFYMLRQLGIYQTDDEVPETLYEEGVRAGDVIYEDITGDGRITSADRQVVGNANPDFYGGITNTLAFGNFDVNMFISFKYGNKLYNQGAVSLDHYGARNFAIRAENLDNRWTGEGTSNSVPRASMSTYNLQHSTRFLEDASFIRLQNLTVGYTLPSRLANMAQLRSARFHVAGKNLITLTRYTGMDPDVSTSLNPLTIGIDYYNVPQMRSIEFGVNLGF